MEFSVLGPLQVRHDGENLPPGPPKQQIVLALLAVRAGEAVSLAELIDEVWGGREPASAVVNTRAYAASLRRLFSTAQPGVTRLVRAGSGYLLRADPSELDVLGFEDDSRAGRRALADGDLAGARAALERGLSRWRGAMLDGIPRGTILSGRCAMAEQERLAAVDTLGEVYLRLGSPDRTTALMRAQIDAHPLRERSYGLLMRACYLIGGVAGALEVYQTARTALSEQLGIEPGDELQRLHMAVLNRSPELEQSRTTATASSAQPGPSAADRAAPPITDPRNRQPGTSPPTFTPRVPRTLPADVPDFTGRAHEVSQLLAALVSDSGSRVVSVAGSGGVGKTALCLHVAHRLSDQYPDGQLFANLHGMPPGGVATALEVLGRFLYYLGVDGSVLPKSLDERAELYRHLLADRRVLVVLDDAASDDQITPLIPGSASCGVLINSRSRIGATLGANLFNLDVLDAGDSERLLATLAGATRASVEPDAVAELAMLCGHLPLALRIAGGRLATKQHWRVRKLVDMLRDERGRLHRLVQAPLDVRANIALSYRTLSPQARTLLCRLGDLGLPEVCVWVSSALLDASAAETDELLEQLFDAQLLHIAGHDHAGHARYRLHDLVRLFARERADADEAPRELEAARRRVFGACLFLAEQAHQNIYGGAYLNIKGSTARWPVDQQLIDSIVSQPLAWFDGELPIITAIIRRAARDGDHQACWEISSTVSLPFQMRRDFDGWQEILDVALKAVDLADDRRGRAAVLYRQGWLCADHTDYPSAKTNFSEAARLFADIGDDHGFAVATAYLGMIERFLGDDQTALANYRAAIAGLRHAADHGGTAFALRGIGQIHLQRGAYAEAEHYFNQALETYRQAGSRQGAAQVMSWQGMLYFKQGSFDTATNRFDEALRIARDLGDRPGEAWCLSGLGRCYAGQGRPGRARQVLTEALKLVQQPFPTRLETLIWRVLSELE